MSDITSEDLESIEESLKEIIMETPSSQQNYDEYYDINIEEMFDNTPLPGSSTEAEFKIRKIKYWTNGQILAKVFGHLPNCDWICENRT